MAADEHHEHEDKQGSPLDIAGQQHHRQRHQRDHPSVDGQHQPDLRRRHIERPTDVAQQGDRDEFRRVENKSGQGQRDNAEPTPAVGALRFVHVRRLKTAVHSATATRQDGKVQCDEEGVRDGRSITCHNADRPRRR